MQFVGRDADAGVADGKVQGVARGLARDLIGALTCDLICDLICGVRGGAVLLGGAQGDHDLALLGKLNGVGKQIDEDLAQACHIAHDRGGRIRLDAADQFQLLLRGLDSHQVKRLVDALS